jgi:hypothetical protein
MDKIKIFNAEDACDEYIAEKKPCGVSGVFKEKETV